MASTLLHLLQQTYDFLLDTKYAIFSGSKEVTFITSYDGQEIVRIAKVPIRHTFDLSLFLFRLFIEVPQQPTLLSYTAR